MKRCPECRRDYYDDSLSFCLEDGAPLVQGTVPVDEPATAVLGSFDVPVDNDTTRVFAKSTVNQNRQSEIPALRSDAFPENETSKTFDKRLLLAPIVIALIVLAGYRYFGANTRQIESIAVMPFVNGSGSSDLEYLSDGMAETLIASLSRLPNLSV
ncbi:MAG TPA: hypothetical protein VMZ26_02435, partial [Pyrinomonadaceae bacterium]|nr:hypothetical protein [Pyrinomonadaceae bacterium]